MSSPTGQGAAHVSTTVNTCAHCKDQPGHLAGYTRDHQPVFLCPTCKDAAFRAYDAQADRYYGVDPDPDR